MWLFKDSLFPTWNTILLHNFTFFKDTIAMLKFTSDWGIIKEA